MEKRDHAAAYLAVLFLSLIIVPATSVVGAYSVMTIVHVATETGQSALPPTTEFFVRIGGIEIIMASVVAVGIIATLAIRRHKPATVFVAAAILILTVGFDLWAVFAAQLVYWCTTFRFLP